MDKKRRSNFRIRGQGEPFSSCYNCHQSLPVATIATNRYQLLPVAVSRFQVDISCCCCLSFSGYWTSVHGNSCFVFVNSLLFLEKRIISFCIGLLFKMATYSKPSNSVLDVLIYPLKFDFDPAHDYSRRCLLFLRFI